MNNEYLNSLVRDIDKGNNLIDYFLTLGLSEDIIYSDWLYETNIELLTNSELFSPSILNKFPPVDKSSINIDENIIQHCFPNGFKPIESITEPKKKVFSFVLDNSYYGILFPQKYITCIIFYENFERYFNVYQKLQNYSNEMRTNNQQSTRNSFYVRKDTDRLNRHNSDEEYCIRLPISIIRNKFKNYYAPKCICIVSVHPFLDEFSKILTSILNFSKSTTKTIKPIEKIIDNLVLEVPAPPRGLYKVEYFLFNEKVILTQPKMNDLPLVNYKFQLIFVLFDVEQIIEIFRYLICEVRIVFFSSKIEYLAPVIQGFIQMLFPFKYSYQYITTLPEENFIFLESISPFVVGINKAYNDNFFNEYNLEVEDIDLLIVDLDKITIKFKLNKETDKQNDKLKQKYIKKEVPDLPSHYKQKLEVRLHSELKTFNNNKDKTSIKIESFISNTRDFFFQFMVNILQKYDDFLNNQFFQNNEIGTPSITSLFLVKEFLKSKESSDQQFYLKLINETQMFVDFIYKRMIPKDSLEKLEIVLLDENLFKKHNRKFRILSKKKETPFILSNLYNYKSTHKVNPSRSLTDKEKKEIINDTNNKIKQSFLKKGQEIIIENGEVFILHHFFPIFNNEFFFYRNLREYFIPIVLSDDVEAINIDLSSKTHLSSCKNLQYEMENYVYLCWMQLWAMTFWYHDKEEQNNRFNELLKVIDKVYYHEIEVFNLIFDALDKYGEGYMLLKLFERLIFLRLNPSYSICKYVIRLLEKEKCQFNKNSTNIVNYVKDKDYLLMINKDFTMRKRICNYTYDYNIVTDDIEFSFIDKCINCGDEINIDLLSRRFFLMRKEIEWAICPNGCGGFILPKLTILYGTERNNDDELNTNTQSIEKIILFSPLTLKHNYHIGLIKEFQFKLDLNEFKRKFNPLFWNSIWYFSILELPVDFFFPYEYNMSIRKINNTCLKNSEVLLINEEVDALSIERLNSKDNNCSKFTQNKLGNKNSLPLPTIEGINNRLSIISIDSFQYERYSFIKPINYKFENPFKLSKIEEEENLSPILPQTTKASKSVHFKLSVDPIMEINEDIANNDEERYSEKSKNIYLSKKDSSFSNELDDKSIDSENSEDKQYFKLNYECKLEDDNDNKVNLTENLNADYELIDTRNSILITCSDDNNIFIGLKEDATDDNKKSDEASIP